MNEPKSGRMRPGSDRRERSTKKRRYTPFKEYKHDTVDYTYKDGRKIRINLYGIKHIDAWDPAKLAKRIKERDIVLHERHITPFLPERDQLSRHDIDMADFGEWDRIKSALEHIDTDMEEPKNEPKHTATGTATDILVAKVDETLARMPADLKRWKYLHKKMSSARMTELDTFPMKTIADTLDLRNAIMAAKITHLVKSLEKRKTLPKAVHVLTGAMHTRPVAELIRKPNEAKRIIDFWEKDAPVSVDEFKKSFKSGNKTKIIQAILTQRI